MSLSPPTFAFQPPLPSDTASLTVRLTGALPIGFFPISKRRSVVTREKSRFAIAGSRPSIARFPQPLLKEYVVSAVEEGERIFSRPFTEELKRLMEVLEAPVRC